MRSIFMAIVVLSSLSVPALAQPDAATQAKRHYESGLIHFNLREYKQAISEFQEGYRLHPDPVFMYNLGQAYRLDDQPEQALGSYKAYLNNAPNAPNREAVLARIHDLEPIAEARRRAQEQQQQLQQQQQQEQPQAHVERGPVPDGSAGRRERLAGIITTAVGVGAIGAAVGLGVASKQASDKLTNGMPGSMYNFTLDRQGRNEQTASIALYAVGGAAIVGGVVVWVLGWRAEHGAGRFALLPSLKSEARADALAR